MNLILVLCVQKRPTFLTPVAFVFSCFMLESKGGGGEGSILGRGGRSCGKFPKQASIYYHLHANGPEWLPPPPFELMWNFVSFLWYVILPPVFFSLLLAVKTLWNSQNRGGFPSEIGRQRISIETAVVVSWEGKPTSEVIEGGSN